MKTIIQKEIQNNIFSFRFLVTFILLMVILTVTVFILTDDYVRKLDEYSRRQREKENYLKEYAHFNRLGAVITPSQPPISFYCLIRGLSSEVNMEEFNNDPLPVMFPLIDLTFLVAILMSLIALLFSYDSISGEREDGTLKLMLSYKISRSKVILGKILGGTLTLLIPFIFSIAIGLLIILVNPRITWRGNDWGALGLVILGSILYFSLFYCLGIFISSRHHSSSASIMTSLFAWVLFVLVIPNLSPYVASLISKTPSRIKVQREVHRITSEERDELGRKLSRERRLEMYKKYPILAERISKAEQQRKIAQDPDYKKAYQELTQEMQNAWDEANRIQREKANSIQRDLNQKEESQNKLAIRVSMISPLSNFTYLATDLSSTGVRNLNHFNQIVSRYADAFMIYIRRKLASLQKEDPTVDWWNIPVDVSDRPVFRYEEEALMSILKGTLSFFVALIIFNLILFIGTYISFIRYDVR